VSGAIYHLSIKVISRGKGKSAVAAAAYRAGEKIYNERNGDIHDYTRKQGIIHTEILLPDHAPSEYLDRAVLWNAVEKIEGAKNSQLAREIQLALPRDLTMEQNILLAREYVQKHFVTQGMCADVCIHQTENDNPHAHIMLTMRPIEPDGSWGAKSKKEYLLDKDGEKIRLASGEYKSRKIPAVDWNEQHNAETWRRAWQDEANAALERSGSDTRINHKSYARQGLDIIPTIHLGVAASQMEKKGIRTERGDINREIMVTNSELRQLKARIKKLNKWIVDEVKKAEQPALYAILQDIVDSEGKSRYQSIIDLKTAAKSLAFLQTYGITDIVGLQKKVGEITSQRGRVGSKINEIERRLDVLDEHIKQSENYKIYRKYRAQYDKLYKEYETLKKARGFGAERKAQKALDTANEYHEAHRIQLTMYGNAEHHLKQNRNSENKIPLPDWIDERDRLNAEKKSLYRDYHSLKEQVREVEIIKRCVDSINREHEPPQNRQRQRQKSHGIEL